MPNSMSLVRDEPVPEQLSIAWRFPPENEERFTVTAPLMPLDGFIYAAGQRGDAFEFVKLDARPAAEIADRQLWSRRFDQPIIAPPAGFGERLVVVESAAANLSPPPIMHCLSTRDGSTLWTRPFADGSPGRSTLDSQRVFVWTSYSTLACLDLMGGKLLWQTEDPYGYLGVPVLIYDIVIAATNSGLTAWDAPTGKELWRMTLPERPRNGPIMEGDYIRLPFENDHKLFRVADGGFVKSEPLALTHSPWREIADVGQPVTPFVTMKGRVYVANDAGEVLCLAAAEQP